MKKILSVVAALAALTATLVVTGCGGGSDNSNATSTSTPTTTATDTAGSGGKGETLDISASSSGALEFNTKSLTAKAGKVTIVMDNPSDVPHAVSIEGNGIDEQGTGGSTGVGKGQKSTVTADLKPGTYTFYCPVDAHEQAGMKGTLTVK